MMTHVLAFVLTHVLAFVLAHVLATWDGRCGTWRSRRSALRHSAGTEGGQQAGKNQLIQTRRRFEIECHKNFLSGW
jgi:hypothetical protein